MLQQSIPQYPWFSQYLIPAPLATIHPPAWMFFSESAALRPLQQSIPQHVCFSQNRMPATHTPPASPISKLSSKPAQVTCSTLSASTIVWTNSQRFIWHSSGRPPVHVEIAVHGTLRRFLRSVLLIRKKESRSSRPLEMSILLFCLFPS